MQKAGDAADRLPQFAIGHRLPAVGEHDPGLPRVAAGGPVDPVSQQRRASLHREPSGQLLSNISNLVAAQAWGRAEHQSAIAVVREAERTFACAAVTPV